VGDSFSSLQLTDVLLPKKRYYMEKIEDMHMQKVGIYTAWLESEDYPKIIASSDLGICLHTSSSKLDLPMKVVGILYIHDISYAVYYVNLVNYVKSQILLKWRRFFLQFIQYMITYTYLYDMKWIILIYFKIIYHIISIEEEKTC